MLNKTLDAYHSKEITRALEQIIEQCGGPETNNPNRLDLAALERVKRLIDRITTETETGGTDANIFDNDSGDDCENL